MGRTDGMQKNYIIVVVIYKHLDAPFLTSALPYHEAAALKIK
jgi:hypothetical protein